MREATRGSARHAPAAVALLAVIVCLSDVLRGDDLLSPPASSAAAAATRAFVPVAFVAARCDLLAVSEDAVAWTTDEWIDPRHPPVDHLYVAPKAGGRSRLLFGPTAGIADVIADGDRFTFTSAELGRVRAVETDGDRWGGVASDRATPTSLAADGDHLYWLERGDPSLGPGMPHGPGAITRKPKRGGGPRPVVSGLDDPSSLFVDDTSVYWTESLGRDTDTRGRRLRRAPKEGGEAQTIAVAPELRLLAVDEGFVFWSEPLEWREREQVIRRAPKGSAESRAVAVTMDAEVTSAIVDGEILYFADANGALQRVPRSGGDPAVIAAFTSEEPDGYHPGRRVAPSLVKDAAALWVCAPRGIYRVPLGEARSAPRVIPLQPRARAGAVAFHPEGGRFYVADLGPRWEGGRARVVDLSEGRIERAFTSFRISGAARPFLVDPDRRRVYLETSDHAIERWDLETGARAWSVSPREPSAFREVAVHALAGDAERLLVGDRDGRLVLIDTAAGARVAERMLPGGAPVTLLPDGHVALIGALHTTPEDGDVLVEAWDFARREPLSGFTGPAQRVTALAVSRDGRWLVSGAEEGRVTRWEIAGRRAIAATTTGEPVRAIAALGDGARVVVSGSRQACLHDLTTRSRLACSGDDGLGAGSPIVISRDERTAAWVSGAFARIWRLDER